MGCLQPTVWDAPPIADPESCPPPSEKHKQMYRQYETEMKQAYQNKGKNEFTEVVCWKKPLSIELFWKLYLLIIELL